MRKTPVIPARIAWSVNQLKIGADQRILEIGAGRGAAAELVCAHLGGGSYLGIDRSAAAVNAGSERNRRYVERQMAEFQQLALEEIDPGAVGRFDTVFAVNVNLFWTKPAQRELALVRELLTARGQLWLFYEAPTTAATSRISTLLGQRFDQAGYDHEMASETVEGNLLLRFRCSPT
jgi:cyclopropane fatty-acyl-phospholipid synthase-like methyltransferase